MSHITQIFKECRFGLAGQVNTFVTVCAAFIGWWDLTFQHFFAEITYTFTFIIKLYKLNIGVIS